MTGAHELLVKAYDAYDSQDADGLSALVSDGVDWPDDANRLHGKKAVRAYWSHQWTRIRTHDEPVTFIDLDDGRVAVRIDQVVRDLSGNEVSRGAFVHTYLITQSRITRMDIEKLASQGSAFETPGGDPTAHR